MDNHRANDEKYRSYRFSNPTVRVVGDLVIENFDELVFLQADESNIPRVGDKSSNGQNETLPPAKIVPEPATESNLPTVIFDDQQTKTFPPSKIVAESELMEACLIIGIFGAERDSVCSHILPALYEKRDRLPANTHVIFIAGDDYQCTEIQSRCLQKIPSVPFETVVGVGVEGAVEEFKKVRGRYKVANHLNLFTDSAFCHQNCSQILSQLDKTNVGFMLNVLQNPCTPIGSTGVIYRPDFRLCLKKLTSILSFRFANALFSKVWNKDAVASVLISMKKKKLDDKEPILESLMHLLNLMSIVCFEEAQMEFTSERIYEARLKALRDIAPPAATADIVLGHIQRKNANASHCSYVAAAFAVNSDQWQGVPFILRCGAGMDKDVEEIRIQLKPAPSFEYVDSLETRNELVLRISPCPRFYLKILVIDGEEEPKIKKLDVPIFCGKEGKQICPHKEFWNDCLTKILLFASEQKAPSTEIAFTDDILLEIRRILSPFDTADLKLSQYTEGSHGPDQSDTLCLKYGYKHSLQW